MHSTSPSSCGGLLLLALVGSTTSCVAVLAGEEPVTPQRPTLSSDTSTAAEGTVELEAGVVWDPSDSVAVPTFARFGVGEATEVLIGGAALLWLEQPGEDEVGIGDLVVGFRHRLVEEERRLPSVAVQTTVKLPTANEDEGLGNGELDASFAGILTKGLGPSVVTAYYAFDILGDPRGSGGLIGHELALASGMPLTDRVGGFAELAAVLVPELDANPVFGTAGLTYATRPGLVFDVAIAVGLNDDAPDAQLLFGFTRNLGPLRRLGQH